MKEKTINTSNPIHLLESVSKFLTQNKDLSLESVVTSISPELEALGKLYGLSPKATILFVLLFEGSYRRGDMSMSDLGKRCGNIFNLVRWKDYLDELDNNGFMLRNTNNFRNEISLKVPQSVIDRVIEGKSFERANIFNVTNKIFFKYVRKYFRLFDKRDIDVITLYNYLENIIHKNLSLPLPSFINENSLEKEEVLFLFYMCDRQLDCSEAISIQRFLSRFEYESDEDIFFTKSTDDIEFKELTKKLKSGTHPLLKKKIIQLYRSGEFKSLDTYCLTKRAMDIFLADMNLWFDPTSQDYTSNLFDVIHPDSIVPENLYYTEKNNKDLQSIEKLLSGDNLQRAIDKGKEMGVSNGITIMLRSEGFGTGKSSFLKKLAKTTNRKLVQVRLSSLKSPYFSESQKNLEELFHSYDLMVQSVLDNGEDSEGNRIPILFIDEISSLFVSRKNLSDSLNSSVNNTLHELSNILLTSLDNFQGILICTSNTFSNSGYELEEGLSRRFTIKINLDSPDEQVRYLIIKDNLSSWVSDDECRELAREFSLTGGQIKVVKQRLLSDSILNATINIERVRELFEIEVRGWKTSPTNSIGFNVN